MIDRSDFDFNEKFVPERMLPIVLEELRHVAAACLRAERRNHTLQPTEIVHEAYIKLVDQSRDEWESRTRFFALAASAVRQVLVDSARAYRATKRGGGIRASSLNENELVSQEEQPSFDVLALDEAILELARVNPRQARVVELRFFGGLTTDEIAAVLGVSDRSVRSIWRVARAWLLLRLREDKMRG